MICRPPPLPQISDNFNMKKKIVKKKIFLAKMLESF